jgi:SAM-dependent methyltransferase
MTDIEYDKNKGLPEGGVVPDWRHVQHLRKYDAASGVPEDVGRSQKDWLDEKHHRAYGRPWALGLYQMQFMREHGLKRTDRLLDFGCGAGRFGVRAIRYLDQDCYRGVEAHLRSLLAFARYEIPLHELEDRAPRLLYDRDLALGHFQEEFDVIFDFFSSAHLPPAIQTRFLQATSAHLKTDGRLFSVPGFTKDTDLAECGVALVEEAEQRLPMLEGHGYEAVNHWQILKKVE